MPDDASVRHHRERGGEGVDSDRGVEDVEGGVERPESPDLRKERTKRPRSEKQIAVFKRAQEARRAQLAFLKEKAYPVLVKHVPAPAPPPAPLSVSSVETTATVPYRAVRKGRSDKGVPRPHTRKTAIVQAASAHRAIHLVYV